MEHIESLEQSQSVDRLNENETVQMVKRLAKIQLAFEMNEPFISWNEKYGRIFDDYVKKDEFILGELAEPAQREEAIARIKQAIYH